MVPPACYHTCQPVLPPVPPAPINAGDGLTLLTQEAPSSELLECSTCVLSPSPSSGCPAAHLPPLPTSKQAASYQVHCTCLLPEYSKPLILPWASRILGCHVWLPLGICFLLARVSFFKFCPFLSLLPLCLEESDCI